MGVKPRINGHQTDRSKETSQTVTEVKKSNFEKVDAFKVAYR